MAKYNYDKDYYDVEIWRWYEAKNEYEESGYGQSNIGTHLTEDEANKLFEETDLSVEGIKVEVWHITENDCVMVKSRTFYDEEEQT